ncbi:MAG TPA: cell wall-binding repeat-containing protein [Candidatus Bathyarchaeota archaeon]|nr:cell wall-binding repeat-containing protein [Candidatus Bathyarchaeota archaeon]
MLRITKVSFLIIILVCSFSAYSISWTSYGDSAETVLPLNVLTIIENNEHSLWDEFAMLSLIPYVVFHENNAVYVSPIVYDCNNLPTQYLLEDWLNYCSQYGGLDTLLTVGNISHIHSMPANHVISFKLEDPLTFSLDVAEKLWTYSDEAVIALINEIAFNDSSSEIMFSGSLTSPVLETEFDTPVTDLASFTIDRIDGYPGCHLSVDSGDAFSIVEVLMRTKLGNVEQLFLEWLPHVGIKNDTFFIFVPGISVSAAIKTYPKSSSHVKVTYFPGKIHYILVNSSPSYIHATLKWSGENTSLKLYLISPDGYIYSSSSEVSEGLHVLKAVGVKTGKWALVVVKTSNYGIANYTIEVSIGNHQRQLGCMLETAANAAVLASKLHAPLILADINSSRIIDELRRLHVEKVYLLGINDDRVVQFHEWLINSGFIVEVLSSLKSIREMLGASGCTMFSYFENPSEFAPAALISAFHNFTVLALGSSHCEEHDDIYYIAKMIWGWLLHSSDTYHGHKELICPYPSYEISSLWMTKLYDKTVEMLIDRLGFEVRKVIISSSRYDITAALDRSLAGSLIVGRMIGLDHISRTVFISRNMLSRFIATLNMRNMISATFTTYAKINWSEGSPKIEYTPDSLKTLIERSCYELEAHTHLPNIVSSLENGSCMWIYLGHGMGGSGFGFFKPDVWRGYEKGGSVENPDANFDGFVDSSDNEEHYYYCSIYDFNASIGNLHSMVFISYGCVSGAWEVPTIFLQHGASAIMASVTTAYAFFADKVIYAMVKYMVIGKKFGEAFRYVIREYCAVYGKKMSGFVYTSWYILMGDIDLTLYPRGYSSCKPVLLSEVYDTEKPRILQFSYRVITENNSLQITVKATDNKGIKTVVMYYSFDNSSWNKVEMQFIGNSTYTCTIKLNNARTVYIYVEAVDFFLNVERTAVKEIHLESAYNLQLILVILFLPCIAILVAVIVYRKCLCKVS